MLYHFVLSGSCDGRRRRIELMHCFFESNHASGVQDSAGKDPRIAMTDDMGLHRASFSNAHECYVSASSHGHVFTCHGLFQKLFVWNNKSVMVLWCIEKIVSSNK
jgi:hypothetical protein